MAFTVAPPPPRNRPTSPGSARATDPRPARTRAAILAAIERLGERDEDLTVAAVVAEAQIARASFYAQYQDLGDVAVQLMRDLHRDLLERPEGLCGGGSGTDAARLSIEALCEEFERRRSLYRAVLGSGVSGVAIRAICEIIAESSLPAIRRLAPSEVDPRVAAHFISSGLLTLFTCWLLSPRPVPVALVFEQVKLLLPPWLLQEPAPAERDGVPAATGSTG